jgi:hypothetical protein
MRIPSCSSPATTAPHGLLFDLDATLPERYSLARDYPEVVERLAAELVRAEAYFRVTATRPPELSYPP